MVFCSKCGKNLPENAYFCPACGMRTGKGAEANVPMPYGDILSGIAWYRAQKTMQFEGNVNANAVVLAVANRNGPINVSTWDQPGYRIELTIKAKGYTDIEAQSIIDSLNISVTEQRVQNTLKIVLNYDFPDILWKNLAIEVTARLPTSVLISLDLKSSNGSIYLTNINGDSIDIKTSNGQLVLNNVYANNIQGSSSNGAVTGEIEAVSTVLNTSNGQVALTVSSSSNAAYDLDLSTSNGEVTIDLTALEYTKNERTSKIAKTTGFENQNVQVVIRGKTSNGNIKIGP